MRPPRRRRPRAGLAPGALSLALAGCTVVGGSGEEFSRDAAPSEAVDLEPVARRAIDAGDLRRHVGFLASDALRGRDTPSPELERVASWIAERFREAGLEPAGEHGGYIQFWPYDPEPEGAARVPVPNVVGVLGGADPARSGEYIVVTAHFDGLGVGAPGEAGDSVYNGADDNASGTAALLELAEAFRVLPARPARPVLFLATSGHEKGLLGVRWFAENPTVFLTGAVAVLTMDMVGRNHPDSVAVIGSGLSSLGPLLERIARETPWLGLTVDPEPAGGEDLFRRGDAFPFARLGIPAVALSTGPHEDHHRPSDEPGAVDYEKAARVTRLVFLAVHRLASLEADATWTEAGRRAVAR